MSGKKQTVSRMRKKTSKFGAEQMFLSFFLFPHPPLEVFNEVLIDHEVTPGILQLLSSDFQRFCVGQFATEQTIPGN